MKIIDIGICIDNFDPAGLGTIRCVRYSSWTSQQEKALDYTKWDDNDLFIAYPFLPTNINFIPEKGQAVKIINYNTDKETVNTEYIAGPFTTMFDYNSQTHSAQVENTTYGIAAMHGPSVMDQTKEDGYKNPKSKGAFAKLTDYGVYGKYGSDVIFTENGLQLRGGKLISKSAASVGQKTTMVSQPIMSEKMSSLHLKKFSSKKEFKEEKVKTSSIAVSDLKHLIEYSIDSFSSTNRKIDIYVYKLNKPYGGLYRTDNPKLSEAPFIQNTYTLLNADNSSTTPTITLYSQDTEETYCTIRDVLKTLHLKSLNEFNSSYSEDDLHPFYFRPTSECKNRIITAPSEKTERTTIFNKILINSSCGPINGLVFSKTKVSPPLVTVTKKENILKTSNIPGEQSFSSLRSDKIYFLSTDTNESNKGVDFYGLNKYELTQENYLKDIDPNTYSTVRGENLLEILRAIIDLLNGHQHNLVGPLVKGDPNYVRLMSLYTSLENDILNKSIRIN
jgi:hypothetical protein